MTAPLRDFASLEAAIAKLPPPKPGLKRIYRGQTANFPEMLSSACRPGSSSLGRIWDIALLLLREQTLSEQTSDDTIATLMNMGLWFKVLAQHYGPGSPYLDVTTSPEVALWFALNLSRTAGSDTQVVVEHPGMPPIPVLCAPLSFAAHRDGPGWFYVLDVPVWDGESFPKHGDLVALEAGPQFVARCPRVRRQHGALVLGDADIGGGDLSGFYACPPIPVAREFEGSPFVDCSPAHCAGRSARNGRGLYPPGSWRAHAAPRRPGVRACALDRRLGN